MPNKKVTRDNEEFSNIILAILILMGFVFLISFFVYYVKDKYGISDTCGCKVPIYVLFALLASLGVFIGCITYYLISKQYRKANKDRISNAKKTLDFLPADERTILSKLIESKGVSTQNNLVKKTKFTKVKVSRIISKLEQKKVIEKQKDGMTNNIRLKEGLIKIFI